MTTILWVIVVTLPILLWALIPDVASPKATVSTPNDTIDSVEPEFISPIPVPNRLPRVRGSAKCKRCFLKRKERNRVRNRLARKTRKINQKNG
jgi:hypothetical protein